MEALIVNPYTDIYFVMFVVGIIAAMASPLFIPNPAISFGAMVIGFIVFAIGFFQLVTTTWYVPDTNRDIIEHSYNLEIIDGSVPSNLGDKTYVVALLNDTNEYADCLLEINYDQEFEVTCGAERRWPRDTIRFQYER